MRGGDDRQEGSSGSTPGQPGSGTEPSPEQKRRGLGIPAGDGEQSGGGSQEPEIPPDEDLPVDVEFSEPDASPLAEWLGQVGVYLGVFALLLAVAGIGAGLLKVRPWSGLLLTLSLVAATVAMVLGAVFQVSTGNVPGFD
jgi:hypothetical protein